MPALIYFYFYFGSPEFSITLVELSFPKLLHSIKIDEIDLKLLLLFFSFFSCSFNKGKSNWDVPHLHLFFLSLGIFWLMALFLTTPFLLSCVSICSKIPSYLHCCIFILQSKSSLPLSNQLQTLFFSILFRSFVWQLSPAADQNLCLFFPYSCHEVISVCDITVGCCGKSCDIWSRGL